MGTGPLDITDIQAGIEEELAPAVFLDYFKGTSYNKAALLALLVLILLAGIAGIIYVLYQFRRVYSSDERQPLNRRGTLALESFSIKRLTGKKKDKKNKNKKDQNPSWSIEIQDAGDDYDRYDTDEGGMCDWEGVRSIELPKGASGCPKKGMGTPTAGGALKKKNAQLSGEDFRATGSDKKRARFDIPQECRPRSGTDDSADWEVAETAVGHGTRVRIEEGTQSSSVFKEAGSLRSLVLSRPLGNYTKGMFGLISPRGDKKDPTQSQNQALKNRQRRRDDPTENEELGWAPQGTYGTKSGVLDGLRSLALSIPIPTVRRKKKKSSTAADADGEGRPRAATDSPADIKKKKAKSKARGRRASSEAPDESGEGEIVAKRPRPKASTMSAPKSRPAPKAKLLAGPQQMGHVMSEQPRSPRPQMGHVMSEQPRSPRPPGHDSSPAPSMMGKTRSDLPMRGRAATDGAQLQRQGSDSSSDDMDPQPSMGAQRSMGAQPSMGAQLSMGAQQSMVSSMGSQPSMGAQPSSGSRPRVGTDGVAVPPRPRPKRPPTAPKPANRLAIPAAPWDDDPSTQRTPSPRRVMF